MRFTVEEVERQFLALTGTYSEARIPVHQRWEMILRWLPLMRGRHLYEDLTDVYADAEKRDGLVLRIAYDLACIQVHFWTTLRMNGCCLPHVYLFGRTRAEAAQVKLGALVNVTRWAQRKRGEIIPAHRAGTPDRSLIN